MFCFHLMFKKNKKLCTSVAAGPFLFAFYCQLKQPNTYNLLLQVEVLFIFYFFGSQTCGKVNHKELAKLVKVWDFEYCFSWF